MLHNDLLKLILREGVLSQHSYSNMADVIDVLRDQDFSIDNPNNARNNLLNSFDKYEIVFKCFNKEREKICFYFM
jgi:hypothetical protein